MLLGAHVSWAQALSEIDCRCDLDFIKRSSECYEMNPADLASQETTTKHYLTVINPKFTNIILKSCILNMNQYMPTLLANVGPNAHLFYASDLNGTIDLGSLIYF